MSILPTLQVPVSRCRPLSEERTSLRMPQGSVVSRRVPFPRPTRVYNQFVRVREEYYDGQVEALLGNKILG